jgi:hypothetical protein
MNSLCYPVLLLITSCATQSNGTLDLDRHDRRDGISEQQQRLAVTILNRTTLKVAL